MPTRSFLAIFSIFLFSCLTPAHAAKPEPKADDNAVMIKVTDYTDEEIGPILDKMKELDAEHKQVWLLLDSYGGSVDAGNELIQQIQLMHQPVTCVESNKSMSMSFFVSQYCDKRLMDKTAVLMAHKPWGQVTGNSTQLRENANYLDAIIDGWVDQTSTRMKMSRKDFEAKIDNKVWYMGYREALKVHAVDDTISLKDCPELVKIDKPVNSLLKLFSL